MSPISREREYARRRYEKWQTKQREKLTRQRRQRRVTIISAAAVAVVLVIAGATLLLTGDDTSSTAASATPSPSASASGSAGPNPCPAPTVKPPAKPQRFKSAPDASLAEGKTWTLTFTTSCGKIVAELDGAKAPKAVANAIFLSGKGYWDGSPCHRLGAEGLYMLQCGDPTGTGSGDPGYQFGPIENAPADKIYKAGTIAMARSKDPNSMGSQFFLVFADTQLDGGYTVFGKITSGLDVVKKIADGGITTSDGSGGGKPARAISIVSTSATQG